MQNPTSGPLGSLNSPGKINKAQTIIWIQNNYIFDPGQQSSQLLAVWGCQWTANLGLIAFTTMIMMKRPWWWGSPPCPWEQGPAVLTSGSRACWRAGRGLPPGAWRDVGRWRSPQGCGRPRAARSDTPDPEGWPGHTGGQTQHRRVITDRRVNWQTQW